MDVAQPIWSSGLPTKNILNAKNALLGQRGQSFMPLWPSYGPHWSGLPIFEQKLFQWQNCFRIIQIWMISTIQDVGRSEKLKKGQKFFWRPNKGQSGKNPNFHNFFDFLRLIGSKNWHDALFFHFRSHKGQKGHYKAKS